MRPALVALLLLSVPPLALACKGSQAAQEQGPVQPHHTLSNAGQSWCPEGFDSGPNDTCFAIPEQTTKDTAVVVYLHGMFQGQGAPEEWAAIRAATQKGYAVFVPRGKRGLCPWKAEFKDYYCWPQDPDEVDAMKALIAEWDKGLFQVDALLEPGTHKRYVVAYSNGGFFGSYVATHGLFPAQAWAIVNAGQIAPPPPVAPPAPAPAAASKSKAAAPPPASSSSPIILVAAQDDAEQAPKVKELHEALTKSSWPHAYCPHPGGPALTPDDVDSALKFFKRDADGALKPTGTTYSCEGPPTPPTKK
ncbi:MAG: hypothetical protein KIT84_22330 [Labilithrix sp.]|nr:hypothetical protein [Labilithrix sp.]MCW5813783.1 hypothetical protein [Labilithrix sp.]